MGRHGQRALAATLLAVLAAALASVAAGSAPGDRALALGRARAAYAAMLRAYTAGGAFRESAGPEDGAAAAAHAWPVSQAIAASIAMASIPRAGARYGPDVTSALAQLDGYWSAGAAAGTPGGYASSASRAGAAAQYYDDNEWIALDLVEAYRLHPDPRLLLRAREIFQLVVSGWAFGVEPCPGGVYWMRSADNRDRNAVTTLNGAILGLRLYALTQRPGYLRWARRMFDWSDRCLTRGDGLVADHIALDGTRDERAWSYNQGAYVAAAVLLAQASRDDRYLDAARRKAETALRAYGPAFAGEPRIFVAIFFRDLALLDAVRPDTAYRSALARYADAEWRSRDPASGLFGDPAGATLLDQAAMVQAYALLAV